MNHVVIVPPWPTPKRTAYLEWAKVHFRLGQESHWLYLLEWARRGGKPEEATA